MTLHRDYHGVACQEPLLSASSVTLVSTASTEIEVSRSVYSLSHQISVLPLDPLETTLGPARGGAAEKGPACVVLGLAGVRGPGDSPLQVGQIKN